MNKYEIMYIVRPTVEEEAQKALLENMVNVLTERGAENVEAKLWAKRDLAYEINDYRTGYYYLITANSNAEANNEFDRLARINEDIIRHIVIAL